MKEKLEEIRERLKPGIGVELRTNPEYAGVKWSCVIYCEREKYPYHLRFQANDPEKAVLETLNYLNGESPQPHGDIKISCEEWQKGREEK